MKNRDPVSIMVLASCSQRLPLIPTGFPNGPSEDDYDRGLREIVTTTLAEWKQLEETRARLKAESGKIEFPLYRDVINGRGSGYYIFSGNQYFQAILDAHSSEYEEASRKDKPVIAKRIVEIAINSGSRFLRRDVSGGGWEIMDFASAREKVSHAFRSRRSTPTGPNKRQRTNDT